ncbi:MAG TPA: serpin family protein, partial [Caldilineae bacterium]|nr:serpin family protein [Caldilineae bacterium]
MSFSSVTEFLTPDAMAVAKGTNAFALDLYQQLRHEKGNLFFSPYSISVALAMTYAGARGNTAAQMAQTLHFPQEDERLHEGFAALGRLLDAVQEKGDVLISVANALWPQEGYVFLASYLDLVKRFYGVSITPLDFVNDAEAARVQINARIEEETRGKISDLIPPGMLDSLTTLVLTNAIYFKGNWANQFDKKKTKENPFWLSATKAVDAPMMTQKRSFGYAAIRDLQILELPYVGGDLSMILLLPRSIDGLPALEDALTAENLGKWTRRLRPQEVEVFLPKFKATSSFSLSETLAAMGMKDVFGAADFSGMTGKRDLFISEVLHKAFIEVNEEGSEAAAATAVLVAKSFSFDMGPTVFKA